jgi:hypothetical protein
VCFVPTGQRAVQVNSSVVIGAVILLMQPDLSPNLVHMS